MKDIFKVKVTRTDTSNMNHGCYHRFTLVLLLSGFYLILNSSYQFNEFIDLHLWSSQTMTFNNSVLNTVNICLS